MLINSATIAALATPQGVGGLHVIRLSGDDAITIADKIFKGTILANQPTHTIHYGQLMDGDEVIDEVVISVFKAPKSYTKENTIEISCHGSPYIAQRILGAITKNGARIANPGEFTLRAFMNGRLDLSQAEAVADLIASENEGAHRLAIQQLKGGFARQISALRQELIDFAALIELELDFSEEDVEFANRAQLIALVHKIQKLIGELTNSFQLGNVLKNGVSIVIAGRPNAGKSTLLNALLNEERAIVSEIAGTTRDTIEELIHIDGIAFRFIDTAGIRTAQDHIENIGIERTIEKLKKAGIAIYLFDASTMTGEEVLADITQYLSNEVPILLVGNKIDILKNMSNDNGNGNGNDINNNFDRLAILKDRHILYISSKEQLHLDQLRTALKNMVITQKINPNQTVISNARHYDALMKADAALTQVLNGIAQKISGELVAFDIRAALDYMGEISGQVSNEDLLDSIFSRFCIGK